MKALIPVTEAIKLIQSHVPPGKVVEINTTDPWCVGLTLAESIFADRDIPPFHRAAVDGYAIRFSDFEGGIREFQLKGELKAGSDERFSINSGEALHVMTGAPVPDDADTMVMVEDTERHGESIRLQIESLKIGVNIARQGEDARRGDPVLKTGQTIHVSSLPLLQSVGQERVKVFARPTAAHIATGDELVPFDELPLPHQIRDATSLALDRALFQRGVRSDFYRRVKDSEKEMMEAIYTGSRQDLLIITGGVSMGTTDRIPELLQRAGYERIFHGVAMKPGKPLFFGVRGDGHVAFGLPGNPVSSLVAFRVFVDEWICKYLGMGEKISVFFPLERAIQKKGDREHYLPCRLTARDGKTYVLPDKNHGSGDFVNLAGSHGILKHPADRPFLEPGEPVEFLSWGVSLCNEGW